MSTELDSPLRQSDTLKKKQKRHPKSSDKKRKRDASEEDEAEPALSAKKHRTQNSTNGAPSTVNQAQKSPSRPLTSPFYEERVSLYLPIAPVAQRDPVKGLCAEHLSPLILTYYPPLHGVILSYHNPRPCSEPRRTGVEDQDSRAHGSSNPPRPSKPRAYAVAIDEYAAPFVWLTVTFVVFRPQKGDGIEGYINLQNESQVGALCWNFFNATVDRSRLPRPWEWVPGGTLNARSKKVLQSSSSSAKLKAPARGSSPTSSSSSSSSEQQNAETGSNGTSTGPEPADSPAMVADSEEVNEKEGDETTGDEDKEDSLGCFKVAGQSSGVKGLQTLRVLHVDTPRSAWDYENGLLGIECTMLDDEDNDDGMGEDNAMDDVEEIGRSLASSASKRSHARRGEEETLPRTNGIAKHRR